MIKNKDSTLLCSVNQILKTFADENDFVHVDENCDPKLIQFLHQNKTEPYVFILDITDKICPECGSKLHVHDTVDYKLNNTVPMKKTVYKCSNNDCKKSFRAKWSKYVEPECNYTVDLMNKSLELGLICNISDEQKSEIINLFTGVRIPRNTVFFYSKINHNEFVDKENKIIEKGIKEQEIKFSNVLSYDEQYVLTNEGWMLKLMAMDPVSKYIYDYKIVSPDDFDLNCVVNFLKTIVEEHNIKYLSADGAEINKKAAKELNLELKLCNFHKMHNLMNLIKRSLRGLKRRIKTEESKIEKNNEKIEKIKELRKGQKGRTKKDDTQGNKLVKNKRKYKSLISKSRSKIKKSKDEIKKLNSIKDAISKLLNSKTYTGGINRYNRIKEKIKQFPQKTHSFILNMEKDLDSLLRHTMDKNVPTTNNCIELCHKHTLNGYNKRKYNTVEGIEREMNLKRIRWIKRCVLGWV